MRIQKKLSFYFITAFIIFFSVISYADDAGWQTIEYGTYEIGSIIYSGLVNQGNGDYYFEYEYTGIEGSIISITKNIYQIQKKDTSVITINNFTITNLLTSIQYRIDLKITSIIKVPVLTNSTEKDESSYAPLSLNKSLYIYPLKNITNIKKTDEQSGSSIVVSQKKLK